MYGCKLIISRVDAELVRRNNVSSQLFPLATAPTFDEEIEDGDIVEIGNVKIRCVLTPGHTEGVMSFFFDTTYRSNTYTVGLFGGAGTNALTLPYILKNGYTEDLPLKMLESIELLRKEKVDIHLGNHPANNRTLEKREKQVKDGGNPFIDESSWIEFLDSLESEVRTIILNNKKLDEEFYSQA